MTHGRRSRGAFGNFLTRDDIEQARPYYLGEVVRRHMPYTSSEAFFTPPLVSVNGGTPSGVWAVNDFRPSDVEAVEVYRGNRMMPAEFSTWGTECGLVVVRTRG